MSVDRISQLPQIVIDRVLSLLPDKEAARSSILSKTWLNLWSTRSFLVFNQSYFHNRTSSNFENTEKFCNFVENTFKHHRHQRLRIQAFKLSIGLVDAKFASFLSNWLKIATQSNLECLHLAVYSPSNSPYVVPNTFFEAAKSLTQLTLFGSHLSLSDTVIKCHNLKRLLLHDVSVHDSTIQNVVSNCPLIEFFHLVGVSGIERIRLTNLLHLTSFRISTLCKLKEIVIEAPSLQHCHCDISRSKDNLFIMGASQFLKFLMLGSVGITDLILDQVLSTSSCLEELTLSYCNVLERINASSHSLKQLSVRGGDNLVELKVDAPNLLQLHIGGLRLSHLSLASSQAHGKPCIWISYDGSYDIDDSWFYDLREFLSRYNASSLSLDIESENIRFTGDLRLIPLAPQFHLEELDLQTSSPMSSFATLVNGLLWSCHPKTVLFTYHVDFIALICKELEKLRNRRCCVSEQRKRWQHQLQDWNIKSFDQRRNEWKALQWKSLVDGSSSLNSYETLHFTLEWSQVVHKSVKLKKQKLSNGNGMAVSRRTLKNVAPTRKRNCQAPSIWRMEI